MTPHDPHDCCDFCDIFFFLKYFFIAFQNFWSNLPLNINTTEAQSHLKYLCKQIHAQSRRAYQISETRLGGTYFQANGGFLGTLMGGIWNIYLECLLVSNKTIKLSSRFSTRTVSLNQDDQIITIQESTHSNFNNPLIHTLNTIKVQ